LACFEPAAAQIRAQSAQDGTVVYTNDGVLNAPATISGRTSSLRNHPSQRNLLEPLVRRLAERRHLDPRLVEAVISVESGWNPEAISAKSAEGLMQLMPATSRQFGVQNAFDPADNVRGGVRDLGNLVRHSDGDLRKALAAYYAGQGTVERAGGVPASHAVTQYVRRVLDDYFHADSRETAPAMAPGTIYETVDERGRLVFSN
jgi:soluble lytic murein transglycosylase-like protein